MIDHSPEDPRSAAGARRRPARLAAVLAFLGALPGPASCSPRPEGSEGIVLSNGAIRIELDETTGAITAVDNLTRSLSLLPESAGAEPPVLVGLPRGLVARPRSFTCGEIEGGEDGQSIRLRWDCDREIAVEIALELPAEGSAVRFRCAVLNSGKQSVVHLAFPRFSALAPLGERSEDDVLVHAFVRGVLVRDPARSLDLPLNPLASQQYPQAYAGMTHQLIDYYSEGRGGFFFAALDPHSTEKLVSMPVADGRLAMEWRYSNWDKRPGAGMDLGFDFVIGANTTGDWYEAADFYRDWAHTTDWCTREGPNRGRPEDRRARWLFEEIGLATFGTSARVDQSAWYRAYHDIIGAPILHVPGHDWKKLGGLSADRDPYENEFHPENLRAIRESGDRFSPFYSDHKTNFLTPERREQIARLASTDRPQAWPEPCPSTDFWRELHASRSIQIVQELGADASYWDASAANRQLACAHPAHPHPPGWGRWMNDAYRALYRGTRQRLAEACGRYVPLGVELMHEGLIDSFDFYQARNGGGFMGSYEAGFLRGLALRHQQETVPVFAYIYHEYAPVSLDGCGKVSARIGDIFYWMAARVTLWGSVFELNNESTPTERFPGMERVGQLHYRGVGSFEWLERDHPANSPYDEKKGAFLRDLVAARTGFANDFLAYGRMLPPLEVEAGEVSLSYDYYANLDWGGVPNTLNYSDAHGEYDVPRVLHAAWQSGDRLGLLFVNLGQEEHAVKVRFDLGRYERYGLSFGEEARGERVTAQGREAFSCAGGDPVELVLPPRRIVLIELPAGD